MTAVYTLQEAKSSLRELVGRAAAGEELVITDGKATSACLGPCSLERQHHQPARKRRRQPGGWEGQVKIHDSFDDPLELGPTPSVAKGASAADLMRLAETLDDESAREMLEAIKEGCE